MTAWAPDAASLLGRHGPVVVMLATAYGLRRSLGAWPVYLTVLGVFAAVEGCVAVRSATLDLAGYVDMMMTPSLLFVLARRQIIPGLRRGKLSEAERLRWIARESLRRSRATTLRPASALRLASGLLPPRPAMLLRRQ